MGTVRDYYADLELPPTADVQDVKKQFRKLALKWHPDRNPGREDEVNARFQIIQSAHEILGDPEQKAKYDASRKPGAGRYPRASGVRGNPWSNAGSQFPTPPRRNQNQSHGGRNPPPPPPPPPSGAQRWQSRFSQGPPPPTAKHGHSAESEAKKNAASAFEKMRKGGGGGGASSSSSNNHSPRKGPSSHREPRSANPPPPPPRTESARQRAEASFGNRKSGYYPYSNVDEPPASNTHYTNTRPHVVPPEFGNGPMPDPLRAFRSNNSTESFTDERQSTPYVAAGGERTNPFEGAPLHRAKSTRDSTRPESHSPNRNNASSHAPNRSSSVPRRAEQDRSEDGLNVPEGEQRPHTANEASSHGKERHPHSDNAEANFAGREHQSSSKTASDKPAIFTFGAEQHQYPQDSATPSERGSAENINTQFSSSGEADAWRFQAGADPQPAPTGQPAHPSPTRHASEQQAGASTQSAPAEHEQDKFNAEGWSDKFGPHTFEPQPKPSGPSPTKNSRSNSRKASKVKSTAGTAAVVEEGSSEEDTYDWRERLGHGEPGRVESPQAMDIDSPPRETPATQQETQGARKINVEPTRPEWRSGAVDSGGVASSQEKTKPDANAAGSEDSEEFRTTFNDVRKVPPFAAEPADAGLTSLNDLKDTLPFESKAASQVQLEIPKPTVQPLAFPPVPQAPRLPPALAISTLKPSMHSWQTYVVEFEEYLRQWEKLSRQVIDHFVTRKAHITRKREASGYAFLAARDMKEVNEYYAWLEQDVGVRQQWQEACVDHEKRVLEFMQFKKKMLSI